MNPRNAKDPRIVGAFGEYTAARMLREEGYDIFSKNFATPVGELDLVAFKKGVLCFVEVKTRRTNGMYRPADAVDFRKEENIKSAAASYINKYKLNYKVRFDIIEVCIDENGNVVDKQYIINAF